MTPIDWTKPVEGIECEPCRVICTDRAGTYPIVVLAKYPSGHEACWQLTTGGCSGIGSGYPPLVRNVPEKFERTVWVNVYSGSSHGYGTRKLADMNASENRIACIKTTITGHVGQFDE